jgi:hypothetical protein
MADLLEQLEVALADRYAIDWEIGSGGMATVCRVTANLQHPHILPLFDSVESRGLFVLCDDLRARPFTARQVGDRGQATNVTSRILP